MNKGDILDLWVVGMDGEGKGTVFIGDRPVSIVGAIKGEKIQARVLGFNEGTPVLSLAKVIEASLDRIEPKCPYFEQCGGCSLQHIEYGRQLQLKRERLVSVLEESGIKVAPSEVTGIFYPYAYRNKIHLAVARNEGVLVLGFFKEGTKEIVNIPRCILHEGWAEKLYVISKQFIKDSKIEPYRIDYTEGNLRFITARCFNNDIQVTLVGTQKFIPSAEYFYKALKKEFKSVSLYYNMNRTFDGAVYSGNFTHLYGERKLKLNIMGVALELVPSAFMQVNVQIMQKIYRRVLELIPNLASSTVIDLYSGIGVTSLFFARGGAEVVSIELEQSSVDEARRLARINQLSSRMRAMQGDCAALLPELVKELPERKCVVFLDPPRRGAAPEVLRAILHAAPSRIIYLSCSPETLARDLVTLTSGGSYSVTSIEPYDMFPETPHVETLVCLARK